MDGLRCYHCGQVCEPDAGVTWTPCTACGEPVHLPAARRVAASERLMEAVDAEADLEEDQRAALGRMLAHHRRRAIETAAAASPPQPPSPEETGLPEPDQPAREPREPAAPSAAAPGRRERPARRPRPPSRQRQRPSLWSRLGPVFGENLLFALAGFLLVAGAVYFTTTAWTTMSGTAQKLVVAGGLLMFAALSHGAGVALGKAPGLQVAARVLSLVAAALVPAASAVAGLLLPESAALALAAAVVSAALGHLFLSVLARREGGPFHAAALWQYDALVFAGVFAPSLVDVRLSVSTAVAAVPVIGAVLLRQAQRRAAARADVERPGTAAGSVLLATVFAAICFAANLAIAFGAPITAALAPLGMVLAAAALALVVWESALRVTAPVPLAAAFAVAVAGTAMATGDARCLMVAALCAAAATGQVSLRMDRARILLPALALSAVGYLFLPAPVRELALRLRAEAASQLGYEPQRLPLSFYGISFLPYLLGLALLARWLLRAERTRHPRVASVWAMSFAGLLAGMSLLLGDDLRAPMAVLPADGLLLVLLGYLGRSAGAVLAGCLGVLGGLVCALAWLEVPAGAGTAAVAAAVLVLFRLSKAPASDTGFAARARLSYLHAGIAGAGGLIPWLLALAWPPGDATPWSLLHASALAPIAALLRRPEVRLRDVPAAALLPLPALWAAATGAAAAFEALGITSTRAALPAALAGVTLAVGAALPFLRSHALRPAQVRVLAAGLFALHLLLIPGLVAGYLAQPYAWSAILGTAALAVAGGWLALRARVDALLAVAVAEGVFPLHLLAGAWLGDATGPQGLVGPAALALAAGLWGRDRAAVRATASGIAFLSGILVVGMRLDAIPAVPSGEEAGTALGACLLLAALAALGRSRRLRREAPVGDAAGDPSDLGQVAAGAMGAALAPVALLDLLVTGVQWYAAAFLVIAAVAFATAWRQRRSATLVAGYGLLQVGLATVLAYAWQPTGEGDHRIRLALFAAAAGLSMACRPRILRTPATFAVLAALFGAAVVQPVALDWIPPRWWTVPTLGLCALALGVTALPRLSARALAARVLAVPVVGAAALFFVTFCVVAAAGQLQRDPADPWLLDANALAFLAAALALAAHSRSRFRTVLAGIAIASTVFATAPVNALLHGHRDHFFRPDVEAALLALAAAVFGSRHPQGTGWISTGWALGALALLCTAFELQDVSTPATATVLAGLPLAMLLRGVPGPNAALHGWLLVLAAWSWIAFAMIGGQAARLGPWLGLSAVLLPAAAAPWLRRLSPGSEREGQLRALRAGTSLLALGVLVVHCVQSAPPMPAVDLAASLLTCALVAAGSLRALRVPEHAPMVHLVLAAAVTAWLVLATGTSLLAPLDGRHHHALTVLGATLFLCAGTGRSPLGRQLFGAAVAAPLLAIALAAELGGLTFALLSGAAALGLGAALSRARWLGALSLLLANAGLFHLWLEEGVFDPSYYGVPAGLSLVFGAELVRNGLGEARVTALRITGLAVLYGSVLVQVARVSAPGHALVLFALAMAAVAFGAWRRQAAVLVAGVAAVVLDVVAYLAQRGFEQDFIGSLLLVGAGGALFAVAARTARRRARGAPPVG